MISWIFYIIPIVLVGYEIGFSPNDTTSLTIVSAASLLITIPWVICIINAIKNNKIHSLWVLGLIFSGLLVIPFYLIRQTREFNYKQRLASNS